MDRLRADGCGRAQHHGVGAHVRLTFLVIFEDRGDERLPGCSHHDRFLRDGRRNQCACACCGVFAVTSISFLLNAGMSSGLRLVMMLPSSTTSLSTHFAPALMRSVWMDGHEVTVFPFTTPASTSIHGPWQMAATGLPDSTNLRTKSTAGFSMRSLSGWICPPGRISAS